MRQVRFLLAVVTLSLLVVGCGDSPKAPGDGTERLTLHLGFFPNVTHATAIASVETGIFTQQLGPTIKLETATFNAGPAAIEALFSGAIQATYVGPNPALNGFIRSKGEALRVISGATSGGAFLMWHCGPG